VLALASPGVGCRPTPESAPVATDDRGSVLAVDATRWRTGANAATPFRTNVPLGVAGRMIPAGTKPVDRFTISVESAAADAGVLRSRWDDAELAMPFSVPATE
jgi:hypothetical protein